MVTFLLALGGVLVGATTAVSVGLVAYTAFTATGLPAFEDEALRLMRRHILAIRGGAPITRWQRLRSEVRHIFATSLVRPRLTGWTSSTEPEAVWAYGICKRAERLDEDPRRDDDRELLLQVLAHAHGNAADEALEALHSRTVGSTHAMLSEFTTRFASDDTLADAQDHWKQVRSIRLQALRDKTFRDSEWRSLCAPLATNFLDYTGRGTAAGLIVGVICTAMKLITDVVAVVGFTSLLGAMAGHLTFLGVAVAAIGQQPEGPPMLRWMFAHPVKAPIAATLFVGTFVGLGWMLLSAARGFVG